MDISDKVNEKITSIETRRSRRHRSEVWIAFERVTEDGKQNAKCKRCGQVYATNGTTNLWRHMESICPSRDDNGSGNFVGFGDHISREKVAKAIIGHSYPFKFVKHDGIREVFSYLNPKVIEIIDKAKIEDNSESKPVQPCWPDSVEKIFIELMVKEIEISFCLNEKVFKRIGVELAERTCKWYSYSQLRDKFNQLRIRYQDYCKLLKKHGLINNVTATDAGGKSISEVLRISREKLCPMFNDLECIFEQYDKSYYQSPNHSLGVDERVHVESDCKNRAFADDDGCSQEVRMKAKRSTDRAEITTPSTAKKSKDSTGMRLPTSAENVGGNSETGGFSITNCVKFLESIKGVDSETYVKVIKLFKDADWREMFMAMSGPRRLDWLASLK